MANELSPGDKNNEGQLTRRVGVGLLPSRPSPSRHSLRVCRKQPSWTPTQATSLGLSTYRARRSSLASSLALQGIVIAAMVECRGFAALRDRRTSPSGW